MVRFTVILMMCAGLGLTGCQKAKMSKAEKKPATPQANSAPMPMGHPPYPQQQPPQLQQQQQPPPSLQPGPLNNEDYDDNDQDDDDQGGYVRPSLSEDYQGQLNPDRQEGDRPNLNEDNEVEYVEYKKLPRVLDTCTNGCAPIEPQPIEDCRENSTCKEVEPLLPGECAPIHIDGKAKAQKLDILFVIDTSLSMRKKKASTGTSEVEDMAAQMNQFVAKLDPETDYNIGVLLAHGPGQNNLHGKLFATGNGDPLVIRLADVLKQTKSRKGAENKIAKILKAKMAGINKDTNDRTAAQGEVGLLSLYSAVTNAGLRRDIEDAGLFRDNAALNVIFVSDENDACYDYHGAEPRVKDKKEEETFAGLCRTGMNGRRLTEDGVLSALRKLKGENPLILSAIVYNDPATLPPVGPNDENEQGWGYIDIVIKAHGKQKKNQGIADLAGHQYEKALAQLGQFAQHNINYGPFICKTDVNADNINHTSFDIIISKGDQAIGHFSAACRTNDKNCMGLQSQVTEGLHQITVDPNDLLKVMDRAGDDGADARITFLKFKEDNKRGRIAQVQRLRSEALAKNSAPEVEREEEVTDESSEVITPVQQQRDDRAPSPVVHGAPKPKPATVNIKTNFNSGSQKAKPKEDLHGRTLIDIVKNNTNTDQKKKESAQKQNAPKIKRNFNLGPQKVAKGSKNGSVWNYFNGDKKQKPVAKKPVTNKKKVEPPKPQPAQPAQPAAKKQIKADEPTAKAEEKPKKKVSLSVVPAEDEDDGAEQDVTVDPLANKQSNTTGKADPLPTQVKKPITSGR